MPIQGMGSIEKTFKKKCEKPLDKHKSVCYNKDTIKEGNDNLPKGSERK